MVDELNNRAEGQRVWEAVLPVSVKYLDELVVSSFPVDKCKTKNYCEFNREQKLKQAKDWEEKQLTSELECSLRAFS